MAINTQLSVAGTVISEVLDGQVNSSLSENNSASNFRAVVDNRIGIHKTRFSVGQEVIIKMQEDVNPPTNTVFVGLVENITFQGKPSVDEKIILTGRDYTARLQDVVVEPTVYTDQEVSTIVTDIITNFVDDITTTNVNVTTTTLSRIQFKNKNAFDALRELAELSGFTFYIDTSKDLNFKNKASTSTGLTFDSTNTLSTKFKISDQELYNEVFVYGGRYLSGFKETFIPDGAGSVFTLQSKPHNTSVTLGSPTAELNPLSGAIFQMVTTPAPGQQYLVNFEDKKIIFTSGTEAGLNIPGSGTGSLVSVKYNRSLPVVKRGIDRGSVTAYGKRVKVITNEEITDPRSAEDLVSKTIDLHSEPRTQGNVAVKGFFTLIAGQTAEFNFPDENINTKELQIINVAYKIGRVNELRESVITMTIGSKLRDINDTIKELFLEQQRIKSKDMDNSDVITRLETDTGSLTLELVSWFVKTRTLGSSFVLGHPIHGIIGSDASNNPQVYLGDSRSALANQRSGGTFT